jgi:hypothetical protein
MMARDQGDFRLHNPWPKIAWGVAAGVVVASAVLGFGVLSRYQQNGPTPATVEGVASVSAT